jgi:hypothetical protein
MVLKDCELKIKVIALAFVFLIGCIDSCEVNNVFGRVCYKSIIIIVTTGKVRWKAGFVCDYKSISLNSIGDDAGVIETGLLNNLFNLLTRPSYWLFLIYRCKQCFWHTLSQYKAAMLSKAHSKLAYSRKVWGLKVINSKDGKVISVLLPECVVLQVSSVLLSVLSILISDEYVTFILADDSNVKVFWWPLVKVFWCFQKPRSSGGILVVWHTIEWVVVG